MYAVNDDEGNIHVFRFWEHLRIPNGIFRGHYGQVKQIAWLNDDSGFISVGKDDRLVNLWRLKPDEEDGSQLVWQHKQQVT